MHITPSAFEPDFLHSFFILSFSLSSAQLSDVGTCTLCDSSTPSTCQAHWHGTLRLFQITEGLYLVKLLQSLESEEIDM